MLEGVDILGVHVHAVTYAQVLAIVEQWIADGRPHHLATVNPEFVMAARHNSEFHEVLKQADLCVPDGIGLLWAARRLGRTLPERVTGSDLTPMLATRAAERGWRVYLLGAAPGVADRAARILADRNPGLRVAGAFAGSPAETAAPDLVRRIRLAQPDILWVAYGAPAQDIWIARHATELGIPVMIGVGGAFDHIAGVRRRAPGWVQRIHLEWLFRLVTQPWRWRRQLALPQFVWAVMRQSRQKRALSH